MQLVIYFLISEVLDMTFSVVVPIYNVEKYLNECVRSILNQSYVDFECILVDDGSKDASSSICDYYCGMDERVVVIHKENGGLVSARKAGSSIAKGDYIICVDGDDFLDCDFLEVISNVVLKCRPDMITFGYHDYSNVIVDKYNGMAEGLFCDKELDDLRERFLYDSCNKNSGTGLLIYSIWSKAIKRELYLLAQNKVPNSITNGEDILINAFALDVVDTLYNIDYAGYYYRDNKLSMTKVRKSKDLENAALVMKELKNVKCINNNKALIFYCNEVWNVTYDYICENTLKDFLKFVSNFSNELSNYKNWDLIKLKVKFSMLVKFMILHNELWLVEYLYVKIKNVKAFHVCYEL